MKGFSILLLGSVCILVGCGQSVEDMPTVAVQDITAPKLTEITPVASPTVDFSPHYTFKSTEIGTISYSGCESLNTQTKIGLNTIRFTLVPGSYTTCKIKVTDAAGNESQELKVSEFFIQADSQAPVLSQVQPVPYSGIEMTPVYKFSSNESGKIVYGGDCASKTVNAVVGINTITFSTLLPQALGTHNNCTIKVTDSNLNATVLNVSGFTIVKAKPLNDTGLNFCGDYANLSTLESFSGIYQNDIVCQTFNPGVSSTLDDRIAGQNDPVPAGQDAVYGRDQKAFAGTLRKIGSGMSGFDLTKLDSNGVALAKQRVAYNELAGTELAGSKWICVKDNVTGLVWEIKTDDGGLRDKDNLYNFSVDVPQYVNNMNAANICGETSNDWRVPTSQELLSIVNYGKVDPAIDTNYFPNTVSLAYWTSDLYFADPGLAWVIAFDHGFESFIPASTKSGIRLVRSAP